MGIFRVCHCHLRRPPQEYVSANGFLPPTRRTMNTHRIASRRGGQHSKKWRRKGPGPADGEDAKGSGPTPRPSAKCSFIMLRLPYFSTETASAVALSSPCMQGPWTSFVSHGPGKGDIMRHDGARHRTCQQPSDVDVDVPLVTFGKKRLSTNDYIQSAQMWTPLRTQSLSLSCHNEFMRMHPSALQGLGVDRALTRLACTHTHTHVLNNPPSRRKCRQPFSRLRTASV